MIETKQMEFPGTLTVLFILCIFALPFNARSSDFVLGQYVQLVAGSDIWTRTLVVGRADQNGFPVDHKEYPSSGTFRSNRSLDNWVQIAWTHVPTPYLGGMGTIIARWDDDAIYLDIRAEKQVGDRTIPPVPVASGHDDPRIFGDDCVRVFLQPSSSGPVFQIAINAKGAWWDGVGGPGQSVFDASWDADGIKVLAKDAPGYYELHLMIPFAALYVSKPSLGERWKVNLLRTERPSMEQTSWSGTSNFGDEPSMGVWVFEEQPVKRKIHGSVVEKQSGRRVVGAFLETPEGFFRSNASGEFEFTVANHDEISIRLAGFQYETVEFLLDSASPKPFEVLLPRLPEAVIEGKLDALASEHGPHPATSYEPGLVEDLASARVNNQPGFEYAPMFRVHQCCPIGMSVLENGRLLVSYTAFGVCHGRGRDRGNMTFVDSSDDGGKTWHTEAVFSDGRRAPWGNFFHDPLGRLWLFIHRQMFRIEDPKQSPMEWSDLGLIGDYLHPRLLGTSFPIILQDGTWLYSVARWEGGTPYVDFYASADDGETWHRRGSAFIPEELRNTPEPMTVQRKDGSLWMLARVNGGFIGESFSYDNGKTWTDVVHSHIQHTTSRFDIRRLQSGRLLLVKHPDGSGRRDLTAYLSEDEGATWPYSLQLHHGICSYPDASEAADGLLYIVYDVGRYSNMHDTSIRMAKIREADIIAGELVSEDAELDMLIVRAGPAPESSLKFNFAWTMPEETVDP